MKRDTSKKFFSAIVISSILGGNVFAVPKPHAMPLQPEVIYGDVSISQSNATSMQITNSPNAIINWQSFSINANETAQFIQQNAQSAVLNRVVGQDPSAILGTLQSNGKVFLINPNGVVFGSDAVVDTAGLVVSSLALSDDDFINGRFNFQTTDANGAIVNNGFIRAGKNGEVVLIAPQVENNGIIEAEDGSILLAAGQSITLTSLDAEGISLKLTAPGDRVINLGKLIANKGAVGLFADVIANSGSIQANVADSLVQGADGKIRLVASSAVELGEKSEILAQGGDILISSDKDSQISGMVNADNTQGTAGNITILGDEVVVENAVISSSANYGGGNILIGGDYQGKGDIATAANTYVDEVSVIQANAIDSGDGGRVIVWADNKTEMHGSISATGGQIAGNGGFVEVSGKLKLKITGFADLSAANGDNGQLLLDPESVHVVADESLAAGDENAITIDWIEKSLDAATVNIVTGTQDIIIDTPINFDSGNALILDAGLNIDIRQPITATNKSQIILNAGGTVMNSSGQPIVISADSVEIKADNNLALLNSIEIEAVDSISVSAGKELGLGSNMSANSISIHSENGGVRQSPNASINTTGSLDVSAKGDVSLPGSENNFSAISVNTSDAENGGNVSIVHDESVEIVSFGITTPVGVDVSVEPYRAPVDIPITTDPVITDNTNSNGTAIVDPGIVDPGTSSTGSSISGGPTVPGITDPGNTGTGGINSTGVNGTGINGENTNTSISGTDLPGTEGGSGSSSVSGIDTGTSGDDIVILGSESDPVSLLLASAEVSKYKSDTERDEYYQNRRSSKKSQSSKNRILHCTKIHQ